jgi:hypothetical protein
MEKETGVKVCLCLLCLVVAILLGCTKQPSTLVQIQQQRSGDYVLTLFSDSGAVKQHSNKLKLEIRNAASNAPANVSNVQIQSSMRMPGMGPMFGNVSSIQQTGPGQYEFDADFSMAGQWSFVVTFEPNGRAQFNLNAQ